MRRIIIMLLAVAFLITCITGCGKETGACGNENVNESAIYEQSENMNTKKEQIVLAMLFEDDELSNDADEILQKQIDKFNQTHSDYEIVIKEYRREEDMYDGNVTLLQREVVSGEGPDIINYRWDYNVAAVTGKYTVDLRQYIDNDPEIKENVFANILDAFSVDDGLYALPTTLRLNTLAGSKSEIGDINRWDVATMLDTFEKSGKKYPMGHCNKESAFITLFSTASDTYIDWEKGSNTFDSEEFRGILNYADKFELKYNPEEWGKLDKKDYVVEKYIIADVFDIARIECELQTEEVAYAGYPCPTGCGTIVEPGDNVMAISMSSKHKDQAWEFMKQLMSDEYQLDMAESFNLPITRSAMDKMLDEAKKVEYNGDEMVAKAMYQPDETYESFPIYSITDKQAEDLISLIESVDKSYSLNPKVDYVIYEEADAFFAGQQSIDQTIDNIENRVWLYISEKAAS